MYTLMVRDSKVRGSITLSWHDSWDDAHDELMAYGEWRYEGCFGFGICEYTQGSMVAHIYKA